MTDTRPNSDNNTMANTAFVGDPSSLGSLDQRVTRLADIAYRIRHRALRMGEVQGQGYIGQALGVADVLAVLYGDVLRLQHGNPDWDGRDRFLLSIGHYAIALYAALPEVDYIDEAELDTYGTDASRLPMSGMASYTPGMEISGGSLGHGLGIGVGMALGLRQTHREVRVFNLLSDGELNEGSTWEAAMIASHHRLGDLCAIVDVNGQQADGRTSDVLTTEPVEDKWRAFGWRTHRVDGNDLTALAATFDNVSQSMNAIGQPSVVVCDTRIGRGVRFLESRDKTHFIRVDEHEWEQARQDLERTRR